MKKYLIACSLCFYSTFILAQTSSECERALSQAEGAFDQGRLSDIINDHEDEGDDFTQCLSNNVFNIAEKIRAYKLLTKTYLFQDNEEMAEKMFIELMQIDKEHRLAAEDPAELYLLKDKFTTNPIVRIAIRGGVNKSIPLILQTFNTFQSGEKRYNEKGNETGLGIGYWGELLAEKHLVKGIEVAAGFQYRIATYEIEGEVIRNDLSYVSKNTSHMLRFPLMVRYNLNYDRKNQEGNKIKLIPYVFIGGSYDFTLSAKYVDTRRTGGIAYTLPDASGNLLSSNQVALTNVSIMGGMGVRYRIGRSEVDFISFEIRYDNALLNYISPKNRWVNENLNFGIGHVEDDLTLNTISFSVGYTKSFYLLRKNKQYR